MNLELFKEKLLSLMTEEDDVLKMNLVEEISNGYVELETGKLEMKNKYDDLQKQYIETFTQGNKEEEEEVLEIEDEDITIEDLFK